MLLLLVLMLLLCGYRAHPLWSKNAGHYAKMVDLGSQGYWFSKTYDGAIKQLL